MFPWRVVAVGCSFGSGREYNLIIVDSVSSGNNFGFEATAGTVRIANCGMFYNNTNL